MNQNLAMQSVADIIKATTNTVSSGLYASTSWLSYNPNTALYVAALALFISGVTLLSTANSDSQLKRSNQRLLGTSLLLTAFVLGTAAYYRRYCVAPFSISAGGRQMTFEEAMEIAGGM